MNGNAIYEDLYAYITNCRIINTHCHHLNDQEYQDVNLAFVLDRSYAGWMCPPPAHDKTSIENYLQANRCNSFFRWLFAGIQSLYGLDMTPENYGEIDKRLTEANKDSAYHLRVLKDICGYDRILLDKYNDPGSDNGHPDIFAPVYRINMYLYGYDRGARDHNGHSPYDRPGFENVKTFDDYIGAMREDIRKEKARGAVALKNATAYERNLIYNKVTKEQASKAFGNPHATEAGITDFQDYIIYEIARIAQETGLPIQIHTGMGLLNETRAIGLRQLIEEYPDVRFDLFHAGFPWTSDVLALLIKCKNTYVNLCWLPLLSTREAKDFIIKALEVSSANRILWGCDTWTGEESLGAVLAARHVLSSALAEMVSDGAFDIEYARYIAKRILYDNAKELYGV